MAQGRQIGETEVEWLRRYLFDRAASDADPAGGDPFELELAAWLAAVPRFRAFAEANRDKIRKKLRTTPEPEARRDLRAELLIARLLTADKRIELGFEAYGSGNRGPDFTVAFPGERPFNLEVTRPRSGAETGFESQLLAKLHQLPPGAPNAVLLVLDGMAADPESIDAMVRSVRQRADRREDAFFEARGFQGARGFYERLLRLGAVVLLAEAAPVEARVAVWCNRSARIAPPDRSVRAIIETLQAG